MMQSDAVSLAVAKTSMQTGEIALDPVTKPKMQIDPTAWVDDHGDFLFRYAVVRLRDDSIAEDVVQETLLAAIQSITSYSGKATERTWLTSILKHKIIDHFRKSVREVPIDESDTDMSGFDKFFERDDEWTGHWNNDLQPYDWNAITATVQKTGKAIVAHEDSLSFGYGAEIAARIADELFEFLDAPVRRVAATDTFVAYAPQLEDIILPQVADVAKAIAELKSY